MGTRSNSLTRRAILLQEGSRPFTFNVPKWLFYLFPSTSAFNSQPGRMYLMSAAVLRGMQTSPHRVTIGQVSVYRTAPKAKVPFVTLRLTTNEAQLMETWGRVALLSSYSAVLRTTMMLGLELWEAAVGVISPLRTEPLSNHELADLLRASGIEPPSWDATGLLGLYYGPYGQARRVPVNERVA